MVVLLVTVQFQSALLADVVVAGDGGSRESKGETERERGRDEKLLIHPLSVMFSSLFTTIQESH